MVPRTEKRVCPNCGKEMRPTWEHCPYCHWAPQPTTTPNRGVTEVEKTVKVDETEHIRRGTRKIQTQVLPEFYARLVIKEGMRKGKDYVVGSEVTTIGSGPNNDIIIDDDTVSEEHGAIKKEDNKFTLYDLGSANGIWLCSEETSEEQVYEHELNDGDVVRIGETKLLFICRKL
jgi:pSer/pThr/pTyr-binding forkhead associated (FHA) protein